MPKAVKPIQSDSNVKAAEITSRRTLLGVISAAAIAALAAILAAVINSSGSFTKLTTSPPPFSFTGRVINKNTEERIRGVKVSLEAETVPPIAYTDSEGIFSFPLADPRKEIHLWIETEGYEYFDLRVIPVMNSGIQVISLTPKQQTSELKVPPDPLLLHKEPKNGGRVERNTNASQIRGKISSNVSGRVEDESGAAISGARVSIVGTELYVTTSEGGHFTLPTNLGSEQRIILQIEKKGFRSRRQGHLTGEHPATVVLRAEQ